MIEYCIEDANGVIYDLNGTLVPNPHRGSLSQKSDNFDWENKIVDNTFLPGSAKVGSSRLESRKLTFILDRAAQTDADFRDGVNELIYNLEKAVYLIDKTNGLRIKVVLDAFDSTPQRGAEKRSTAETIMFRALTPYWEETTAQESNHSLTGNTFNNIPLDNDGFLEAFPILTFTTTVTVDDILIQIVEENSTLQIQDNLFGTGIYLTLTVDNEKGTVFLDTLDRINSVVPGTGFVSFPKGSLTLRLFPTADCDLNLVWRRRYYV